MANSENEASTRYEISRRTLLALGTAVGAATALPDIVRPPAAFAAGTTYYVAKDGSDTAAGTSAAPFLTLRKAADVAQPGDSVVVRAGVYREEVVFPRGGTSATAPISYTAEPQGSGAYADVTITGSDVFTTWTNVSGDVWQLKVANSYFHGFNPYAEQVHGDWFTSNGRVHRLGMVYLNGAWLPEAVSAAAVSSTSSASWWSDVDGLVDGTAPSYTPSYDANGFTTITAKFPGVNPNNNGAVEVGVRATVFKPAAPKVDHIRIAGFKLTNAATNWAAPTMGQWGLVSAHWCKGWVIEDNEIAYSRCCGIALGKYSDQYDGTRGTTNGYYDTIKDAQNIGSDGTAASRWSFANIGGHTVRNNTIHHCGQTGVVGSLGAIGSTITGNEIYQIHTQGIWDGAEMAGIKLHGAIDVEISANHIYSCGSAAGIWLDWMAQGTRVVGNLMHGNPTDVFAEVDHGPLFLANNLLLSATTISSWSEGVVSAHNLVAGATSARSDGRQTPYFDAHSTFKTDSQGNVVANPLVSIPLGAQQWRNNVLARSANLSLWDGASSSYPISMKANVYTAGTTRSSKEVGGVDASAVTYYPVLEKRSDAWYLTVPRDESWRSAQTLVGTTTLANAPTPNQPFTNTDGTSMNVDKDFLGTARNATTPFPGPFELEGGGTPIKVWRKIVPTTDPWGLPPSPVVSGPGAASDVNGNITVHLRGTDDQVYQRAYTGGAWINWAALGGPTGGKFVGAPAVAASAGRTDVFVRGLDDALWQKTWTSTAGWTGWSSRGGVLVDSPAAAADGSGNITVHVRGTDSGIWQNAFNGTSWSGFTSLGGPSGGKFAGAPALAAKAGRTDVFVRGLDDALWQKTWTSTAGWTGWSSRGGVLVDSPSAAADADGNITVHIRGTDSGLWQNAFHVASGTWIGWSSLDGPSGGKLAGAPAVTVKVGRMDTFVRGLDDQLWQRTWTGSGGLTGWSSLGGTFG